MIHFCFLKDKMIHCSLLHVYDYFVVVELTFTFALQGSVWTVSGSELHTMAEKTERHKSCWKVQGAFFKRESLLKRVNFYWLWCLFLFSGYNSTRWVLFSRWRRTKVWRLHIGLTLEATLCPPILQTHLKLLTPLKTPRQQKVTCLANSVRSSHSPCQPFLRKLLTLTSFLRHRAKCWEMQLGKWPLSLLSIHLVNWLTTFYFRTPPKQYPKGL